MLILFEFDSLYEVPKDEMGWNSVLSSCAGATQWLSATALLGEMKASLHEADAFGLASMLTTGLEWPETLARLCDIRTKQMTQDGILENAAMSCCEKSARWRSALQLLGSKLSGDVIGLSTTIAACEKGSQWHLATHLLRRDGVNEISFNSGMSACERLGLWQLSSLLIERLGLCGLRATEISYNALISCCDRAQQMDSRPKESFPRSGATRTRSAGSRCSCCSLSPGRGKRWPQKGAGLSRI